MRKKLEKINLNTLHTVFSQNSPEIPPRSSSQEIATNTEQKNGSSNEHNNDDNSS